MAQYFDEILVSDKAMVKLVRNGGKDFIFKASKIQSLEIEKRREHTSPEHNTDFGNFFANFVINSIANSGRSSRTISTLKLLIDGDYFYINSWSGDISSRLQEAIKKSKAIDNRKYGEFR
ncbi:hypothetical protein [Serratia marcescens]|uniref:hypothetical protein n=1 Tax=Serratia marcescens TaxID=615 RepID=UPI000666411D|nr:hypothetical protein [Serratia marcescens]BEN97557.1 hypothetical protein SMQC11_08460 [Serratia marcescens]